MNTATGLILVIALYGLLMRLDQIAPFFKRPWAAWLAIAGYLGAVVWLGALVRAS